MKIRCTPIERARPARRGKTTGLRLQSATSAKRVPARRKIPGVLSVSIAFAAALFALSFQPPSLPGREHGTARAAAVETVTILADDCSTPKTTFYLGETVCAIVTGATPPSDGWRQRIFQWVTPNHWATQQTDILGEEQQELFTIPTFGDFARVGKWSVRTADNEPGTQTLNYFIVRDPRIRYADLKVELLGPATIHPNDRIEHTVFVSNQGPDYAKVIEFAVNVPSETVFVGLRQISGNEFKCSTPPRGETGKIVCQTDYMKLDERAEFTLFYQVSSEAQDNAVSNGNAEVYNFSVEEAAKEDNFATVEATVIIPKDDGGDPGEP